MADPITRPAFYEGQILAPDDLTGSLDYGRSQQARHERYLHTWGIATGLQLVGEPRTTPEGKTYKAVTLRAGMAIDPSGRPIVVAEDEQLNENAFGLVNGGAVQADDWYPVFLVASDEAVAPAAAFGGACDVTAPSRVAEGHEIAFGRLGEELLVDEQRVPGVSDGPDAGDRTRVLLGFVQWEPTLEKFADVKDNPEGTGPRYAGVAADEVDARGGTLTLRARPSTSAGAPAVVIAETAGGELQFGLQDARGKVDPVLTITAKGDVVAKGTIKGLLTAGVAVESGIATDGMLVPLPKGIEPDQVESGQVVVHVHVTPRYDGLEAIEPVVCRADGRRVRCRFVGSPATTTVPGRCDYTTLVYISAEGGAT